MTKKDCIGDHKRHQTQKFNDEPDRKGDESSDLSDHSECLGLSKEALRIRRRDVTLLDVCRALDCPLLIR